MMRTIRNLTSLTRPRILQPLRTAPGGLVRKQEQRNQTRTGLHMAGLTRLTQARVAQIWAVQARRPPVRKILAPEISGKRMLDTMVLAPVILPSRTLAQVSLTG